MYFTIKVQDDLDALKARSIQMVSKTKLSVYFATKVQDDLDALKARSIQMVSKTKIEYVLRN
jgi:hypothetical protein